MMRPTGRYRLALAVAIAVVTAARAGETVKLRGYGGPFSHLVRQGTWIQRSITVSNAGPGPRKITVLMPTDVAGGGRRDYRRSVTVPPGAVRRVDLVARTGKLDAVEKVRDRTLTQMFYVVRDADGGAERARAFGLTDLAPQGATVMGSVGIPGEDHDAGAYLDRLAGRELGQVVSAVAGAVPPDRWQGHDMVTILRLEEDIRALRPSQREAVLDWVRRGGLLMLTGGEGVTETLEGPLAAAAGVCAAGVHRVGQLRVVDLADGKPMPPVELGWPMPMLELCPAGAEVLCEANGLPLLTRKPLGGGWVLTLAVPVGALADSRLHRIWWRVAQTRQVRPPVDGERFLPPARNTLRGIAGRRGPTRNLVAVVLAIPVVAIVAAGAWLMRRRRGEWGWLVLIPLAAVMGIVIYAVSVARRDPQRISHVGLISGVGDGVARVQQVFLYYSGPGQRRLNFQAGTPRGVVRELATVGAALKHGTVETAELMSLPDLTVEVDNTRAVHVDTMKATPGITGSLTFGPDGLTGTLSNRLGLDVSQAVVYAGRRTYRLRCVAPGALPGRLTHGRDTPVAVAPGDFLARVRFVEDAPKAKPPRARKPRRPPTTTPATRQAAWQPTRRWAVGEFTGSLHNTTTDRLRNDLVGRIATVPGISTQVDTRAVLIGYADGALIEPLSADGAARQGWSVVVWPIRLAPPGDARAVLIPAGFVDLKFTHVGAPVWDEMNQRFNPTFRPSEMLVHARPPRVIGRLEAAEARLRIRMDATGYQLIVSGVVPRGRGEKVRLKTFDNPRLVELAATSADRFRAADGSYVFSLEVQRIGTPTEDDMMRWAFEEIDVVLKGTHRAAGQ